MLFLGCPPPTRVVKRVSVPFSEWAKYHPYHPRVLAAKKAAASAGKKRAAPPAPVKKAKALKGKKHPDLVALENGSLKILTIQEVSDSAGFVSSRMVPIKAMAVLRKGAGALKPKHDGSNRIKKRSASASPTETTIAAILAAKPALKPAPSKLLGGLWDPKNRPEIRCVRVKKAGSRGTRKLVFD